MLAKKSNCVTEQMPTSIRVIADKLDLSEWTIYLDKGKTESGLGYYLNAFRGNQRICCRMYIYSWGSIFSTVYGSRSISQIRKRGFTSGVKLLESFRCFW